MKLKENVDLKVLEELGFKKVEDEVYIDRPEMGSETYYELNLGEISYKIVESRKDWKWNGSCDIRTLEIIPNDWEVFPRAEDLDIIKDLIEKGLVE